jgi:hypothetical protein
MRTWNRIYSYPKDYLEFVHKYYVDSGVAYLCNYYSIDLPNSVYDSDELAGGSYELIGELSGMKWNKISLMPLYFTEQITVPFTADERGFGKFDQSGSFVLPPSFELTPSVHDFVAFERPELDEKEPTHLYEIVNFEKSTNTEKAFWKVGLKVSQYIQTNIDTQINNQYTFVEHEKKIYLSTEGLFIYKLLQKNSLLDLNDKFDSNSGLYFGI